MPVNIRLLRTPRPYFDEGLKALNLRTTEENGYDSPSWLHSLANLREDERTQITIYTEPRWKAVSEMLNLEIPVLQDLACLSGIEGTPPKFYNMFGHVIPKYSVRIAQPKICPGCLRQSNYLRKIWDLAAFTCCPEHGTLLLDECPNCGKKISWYRGKVSVCPCGQDWRDIFPPEVSESEKILSQLILQICGLSKPEESTTDATGEGAADQVMTTSNPLSTVSLKELLSSVYFIAGLQHSVVDRTGKHYAVKLSHKELHEALTKAAAVFEDWPNNYYKFIGECQGNVSLGSGQSGMYKDFGMLYDPLFIRKNNPFPAFMRDEFKKYITTHWDGGYTGKCGSLTEEDLITKTYMTREEAAKHLEVARHTVNLLHNNGHLRGRSFPWINRTRILIEADSAKELKGRWDKSITAAEAGELLGIGRIAVVSLVKSDCLVAIQGPAVTGQLEWKFEVAEVEKLLKTVEEKITKKENQDDVPGVPFYKAIQKLSKLHFEVGTFVKLILDGKITPVAKGKGIGLSAILFDADEISEFSKKEAVKRREGKHTMEETAKLLRTSNTETIFLVKKGFLIAEKAAGGRGYSWSITREEIDRFNATYSTVGYLMKSVCTSTRGLSNKLMANGIMPVTGPKIDGGSIYFFKKSDLENVDCAQILATKICSTKEKTECKKLVGTQNTMEKKIGKKKDRRVLVGKTKVAALTGYAMWQINMFINKGYLIPAKVSLSKKGKKYPPLFSEKQIEKLKKQRFKQIRNANQ